MRSCFERDSSEEEVGEVGDGEEVGGERAISLLFESIRGPEEGGWQWGDSRERERRNVARVEGMRWRRGGSCQQCRDRVPPLDC